MPSLFSPLDERWGLGNRGFSDRMSRDMVWLSSLLAYGLAQEVMERIGHHVVAVSSLWRESQEAGQRLQAYAEQQPAQVAPERVVLPPAGADHEQVKGVSLEGGMMNIRGEGWKEFKVGAVYDVGLKAGEDPRTGEPVDQPAATGTGYTAILGDVKQFAPALWALAASQQVPTAARSSVTADGAEWIWGVAADYLPDSIQIVDGYHANDHLAQAVHPKEPDQAERGRKWMQDALDLGEVWRIIQDLQQTGLDSLATYFCTHQRRMHYLEFREDGYPLGSGTVESACKQVKARVSGPAMRWSRPGAEHLLPIRSAILSRRFDAAWAAARNSSPG